MAIHPGWSVGQALQHCCGPYRFDLDQGGVKLPVADVLQPREPLLRRCDRPFRAARRSNDDRALAASEKPFVASNFIKEADAIARHPTFSPTYYREHRSMSRRKRMTWINFADNYDNCLLAGCAAAHLMPPWRRRPAFEPGQAWRGNCPARIR
jgi:hypothetical protein